MFSIKDLVLKKQRILRSPRQVEKVCAPILSSFGFPVAETDMRYKNGTLHIHAMPGAMRAALLARRSELQEVLNKALAPYGVTLEEIR